MPVTALPANALTLLRRGALSHGKRVFMLFPGTPVGWQPGEGNDVVQFPPVGRNVSAIVTAPGVSLIDIATACAAFWPDASPAFVPQLATSILVRSSRLGYVLPLDPADGPYKLQAWYVGARVILPLDYSESPVHKWLFVNGEQYGWYPYQNEPWHWEYNPPGFRELFHP
jgi:hypothetical protein